MDFGPLTDLLPRAAATAASAACPLRGIPVASAAVLMSASSSGLNRAANRASRPGKRWRRYGRTSVSRSHRRPTAQRVVPCPRVGEVQLTAWFGQQMHGVPDPFGELLRGVGTMVSNVRHSRHGGLRMP
jgi:hypothetical protein